MLSTEELIDLQLRDLDLSSIELVNLKESITDYMNVYVPGLFCIFFLSSLWFFFACLTFFKASKILSVESIGDFVHVILDHISTQNDSGTLEVSFPSLVSFSVSFLVLIGMMNRHCMEKLQRYSMRMFPNQPEFLWMSVVMIVCLRRRNSAKLA